MKMYMKNRLVCIFIVFCIFLLWGFTMPRYLYYLPTIPIYSNKEADIVYDIVQKRTNDDVEFFSLTDPDITYAFAPYVKEDIHELLTIITQPHVITTIMLFKYGINRPRPYQINPRITYLDSKTDKTPSMPSGHALQAYYLAKVLSKRYPEKKEMFSRIAKKCDDVRVKAGIHYPSDGVLAANIVKYL